jgi:hypothetical protein
MNDRMMVQLLEKIQSLQKRINQLERLEIVSTIPWTNYTSSSTIVGWSSFIIEVIYYKKIGKLVFVQFTLSGTSNSATTTFTLPYNQQGGVRMRSPCLAQDNGGTHVWGVTDMVISSNLVTLYPTTALNAWTASGSKEGRGQFFYEVA